MSGEKLPYFKFYPADFMGSGKVQIMSPAERGIYISLLCHSWQEGPLPDDVARLARVAGASQEEMREAWPAVRKCFEKGDDGKLYHPRLEKERDEAVARSHLASKAARARWDKADADASADADAQADGNADAMPLSDAIPRVSESQSTQSTENTESHSPDGGGIAELLGYLPDANGVEKSVRAIAATAKGSPDTWAIGFLGMYGPSGTRHRELSQLPEDERPEVLLDALQAYLAEGQPWDQRFFSGFVRNAAKRHLGGESPDFGDETRRDHRRRETYRRREGAAGRKKAQEDIERQQAELEELRDWYDDLPPEDQQQIDDDAEARVKVMATGTRGRVPKAMKQAAFLAAVKEARESMQPTTEEKNP